MPPFIFISNGDSYDNQKSNWFFGSKTSGGALMCNQLNIRYLKNYWANKVVNHPKVKIHTSFKPEYSCAICGVSIDGMTPGELDAALLNNYKIHTVGIVWENISCVRITPHVYTRIQDLDKLAFAIRELADKQK